MRHALMLVFILLAALQFVLPVPHTIALRNLLIFMLVAVAFVQYRHIGSGVPLMQPVWPWILLIIWIPVQAMLFAANPESAIREFLSQLFVPLLVLIAVAVISVQAIAPGNERALLLALFVPLILHLLIGEGLALFRWIKLGSIIREPGLTEGPDKLSYLAMITLSLLLGLRMRAIVEGGIRQGRLLWWGLMVIVLVAVAVTQMRLGYVSAFVVLSVFGVLFFAYAPQQRLVRRWLPALVFLVLACGVMLVNLSRDDRWESLFTTVDLVQETHDRNRYWLDFRGEPPHLADGSRLDLSNYYRLSWWLESLRLIRESPLGVGYSRNAFGHALRLKYGQGRGHSHSGWLDLALGSGIPALLLWAGGLLAIFAWAVQRIRLAPFAATALSLLVADFGVRSMFDSVIRDHMLIQFMLVTGVLIGWINARQKAAVQAPPSLRPR